MATSVEDICNQSLRALGVRRRIGWLFEGSEAARAALEVYGQTRDELLRSQDWDFARRPVALVLLKGPPPPGGFNPSQPWSTAYPPPGWLYEYGYPSDAIEIAAIVPPPGFMPDRDPKPGRFRVDNDFTLGGGEILTGGGAVLTGGGAVLIGGTGGVSASGTKVILTDVRNAVAIYRAQVTDPSQWNAGFTAVMIERLAQKLSVALAQSLDLLKTTAAEGTATVMVADKRRG
jgi:hypothetical protein